MRKYECFNIKVVEFLEILYDFYLKLDSKNDKLHVITDFIFKY